MATQEYNEDQSINSMSTRQLRKYIADKSTDLQNRIDSVDMRDTSRAFQNIVKNLEKSPGKIARSTSSMDRSEMVERAYDLRNAIALDYSSGFAKSLDWQENKTKYQSFIKNQSQGKSEYANYWNQFITDKGNVSKKGYQAYKDYINFTKSINEKIKEEFGYRTLKEYGIQAVKDKSKDISKIINQVYINSQGKGLTPTQILEKLTLALDAEKSTPKKSTPKKSTAKKSTAKKSTAKKSTAKKSTAKKSTAKKFNNNVSVKKGKKLKGENVRERLT